MQKYFQMLPIEYNALRILRFAYITLRMFFYAYLSMHAYFWDSIPVLIVLQNHEARECQFGSTRQRELIKALEV